MSSLRRRCRNLKKSKANPYAGRGLDKFALVTAELEAKREKLAAELETPLSMVKFAIGSHNKWIPIILSGSAGKETHARNNKSVSSINDDKLKPSPTGRKGTCGSHKEISDLRINLIKDGKPRSSGPVSENDGHSSECFDDVPQTSSSHLAIAVDRKERSPRLSTTGNAGKPIDEGSLHTRFYLQEGLSSTGSTFTDDRHHVNAILQKKSLTDIEQKDLSEMALQGQNLKAFIKALAAVPWVVSKASTIASSVVFLRWSAKGVISQGKASSLKNETSKDEKKTAAMPVSIVSPPVDKVLASSDVLQVPSTLFPLRTSSIITNSDQEETHKMEKKEKVSALGPEISIEHRRKCKVKGFLKMRSAPSTPRDTRQRKSPYTTAITPHPRVLEGNKVRVSDSDVQVEDAARTTSPPGVPAKRLFKKVALPDTVENARRAGQALAAAGLLVSLSCLAMGYVSAIVGLVCWLYVLPVLRNAVGDRPMVRSHHRGNAKINQPRSANNRVKGKQIVSEGNSKRKMVKVLPPEYKKVIMEGLRDRGRLSNA